MLGAKPPDRTAAAKLTCRHCPAGYACASTRAGDPAYASGEAGTMDLPPAAKACLYSRFNAPGSSMSRETRRTGQGSMLERQLPIDQVGGVTAEIRLRR